MDFAKSLLPLTNRDGTERILVWEKGYEDIRTDEIVKMTVPIRDRRAGSALNIEVQVHADGSLESVGRRLTLFSRLIEEYSVADLPTESEILQSTNLHSGILTPQKA